MSNFLDIFIIITNLTLSYEWLVMNLIVDHQKGKCTGVNIEEMMKNAADEFGPSHIRFNSIRPGFIATEIMEGVPRESEVYESYIENTPMQGVGESEDVANLARFLIGRESRWITGCAINVDGGHALRRGPNFTQFVEPAIGKEALSGGPVKS